MIKEAATSEWGRRPTLEPVPTDNPSCGVYLVDRTSGIAHMFGLFVVALAGDKVCAMVRLGNAVIFPLPAPIAGP